MRSRVLEIGVGLEINKGGVRLRVNRPGTNLSVMEHSSPTCAKTAGLLQPRCPQSNHLRSQAQCREQSQGHISCKTSVSCPSIHLGVVTFLPEPEAMVIPNELLRLDLLSLKYLPI